MQWIFFILCGLAGGILGGMGMGGGTVLIPLLTILLSVNQKLSQGYNLISFLIMSVIAIIIHFKNGLVEKKVILPVVLPAIIFSIFGSLLANFIGSRVLKTLFGIFLITLSIFEIVKVFKDNKNNFTK